MASFWARLTIVISLSAWLGLGCGHAFSDGFSVERYTQSQDGKDNLDALHDIAIGPKGFVWLATESGLVRFDGSRVNRYGIEQGLAGEFASDITFDQTGLLWVATNKGVSAFDPAREHFETWPLGRWFSSVAVDQAGTVYAAGVDGLYRFASGQDAPELLLGNTGLIQTIYPDHQEALWLGTTDQGLYRYDPITGEAKHFAPRAGSANGLPTDQIRAINEDADGRLWIGTWGAGLCRLTANNDFACYRGQGLQNAIITDLYLDNAGHLWASADKGGLYRYRKATDDFVRIRHDPLDERSMLSDTTRAITGDAHGNVWFATFPGGLNRYHRHTRQFSQWQHHPLKPDSLPHSAILAIHEGADQRFWIGTEGGLSLMYKGDVLANFRAEPNLPSALNSSAVTAIAHSDARTLWVGTWSGGLLRFDGHTQRFERLNNPEHPLYHPGENIWALLKDSRGQLWVGSERHGLSRLASGAKHFVHYRHNADAPQTITNDYVLNITESPDGRIWVATQTGLNIWQPATDDFRRITQVGDIALADISIKSLHFSDENTLWIATQSHGLLRWHITSNQVMTIDQAHGLPSNSVASVLSDNDGNIWASTLAGLTRIDPNQLTITALLTEHNGLAGHASNRNALHLSGSGELWLGATGGLTRFNPHKLQLPTTSPQIELTHIDVLGRTLATIPTTHGAAKALSYAEHIELGSDAHYFEIGFANLNFTFAKNQAFRYRLTGVDPNWVEVSGSGAARYANLAPGNYTFHVATKDHSGQWSEATRTLGIRIPAPWWQSTSAYLAYGLIACLILAGAVRLVFLRTLNSQLREQVAARTAELAAVNEAKSHFFANVSHELRTPLAAINGYAKRLLSKHSAQCDARMLDGLNAIARNGEHLNNLLTDILDLSKIESGKMRIQPEPCNVSVLVDECLDDLQASAEQKNLALIGPHKHIQSIKADPQRLKQIMHNLLSNAIKYTEHGHITVSLSETVRGQQRYCEITVADTGKGMDEAQQAKLFQRFEQVDEQTQFIHGYGTGLGLSLVAEFTELHGGFVECESTKGKGSVFRVYLPIDPAASH